MASDLHTAIATLAREDPKVLDQLEREAAMLEARLDYAKFRSYCWLEGTTKGNILMEDWDHFDDPRWSSQYCDRISLTAAVLAGRNVIVLKARQLGNTTLVASLVLWLALYHRPGAIFQIFSKSQDDADAFLEMCEILHDSLPPELRLSYVDKPTKSKLDFVGGGRIQSFPATKGAGRSRHATIAVMDEFAFHEWPEDAMAAVGPQADQMILFSTANGGDYIPEPENAGMIPEKGNLFARMWNLAYLGKDARVAFFFPWYVRPERPTQKKEGGVESIHLTHEECHGEGCGDCDDRGYHINHDWRIRERDNKLSGSTSRMRVELPNTPSDAFAKNEDLMFPQYRRERVLVPKNPFSWKAARYRVFGVDWGGMHDPTAMVVLGMSGGGHIHQFAEYRVEGRLPPVSELAAFLQEWDEVAPFNGGKSDPSGGNSIASLNEALNKFNRRLKCAPGFSNRKLGLQWMHDILDDEIFTMHTSCRWSDHEYGSYYAVEKKHPKTKESYLTDTPIEHHGDLMDARRYAIVPLVARKYGNTKRGPVRDTKGRRMARRYR